MGAAAKQDVVWVAPNFQPLVTLVFRCLERDKAPTIGRLQTVEGSPGLMRRLRSAESKAHISGQGREPQGVG